MDSTYNEPALGDMPGESARPSEPELKAPKIQTLNSISVAVAVVLVVVSIVVIGRLIQQSHQSEYVHDRYDECASAATELRIASDYLTTECRMFVMTGDRSYMDGYFSQNALNPGTGGTGGNNDYTFNDGKGILVGIEPDGLLEISPSQFFLPQTGGSAAITESASPSWTRFSQVSSETAALMNSPPD